MTNRQKILQEAKDLIAKIKPEARDALALAVANNASVVELELLGYPQRYVNSLEDYGIHTIEQLLNTAPENLFSVPQFGDSAFIKLYECLAQFSEWNEIIKKLNEKVSVAKTTVSMQF